MCYQLTDPGSEWRLHRHWYGHSAMRDLLGSPMAAVAGDTLYRCLDRLPEHKRAFFSFLRSRWETLFEARFDVLLYDLTSTYFESDPPFADKRRFGHSRDKRPDCVQVVIALIVTPEGFPLAYEVMPGNTSDKTTLEAFLKRIEDQYGRADRVWIMDRGIPTEETLRSMRTAEAPVHYLVGTPSYTFRVTDPGGSDTIFGIAMVSYELLMLGFDTPRGWHQRIYSGFFSKQGMRWKQPGLVRLYYQGVKQNEVRWTDIEVNEPIRSDIFQFPSEAPKGE